MRRVDFDTWEEILLTITRNKTRSVLTAFGIFGEYSCWLPSWAELRVCRTCFHASFRDSPPIPALWRQTRLRKPTRVFSREGGGTWKSGCRTHTQLCARHRCGNCHHRTMGSKYRTRGIHAIGNPERTLSGIRQDRRTDYPYGTFAERNRHTRPPEGMCHREAYLRNALSQERQSVRTIHRDKWHLLPCSRRKRGYRQHVGQRTVGNLGGYPVHHHAAEL